ncbi:MAG: SIS domain-containing protein [Chloroflexi bacterium]|nr:SIS domain-containing protein [Chloroflexota bacterium]
MTDALDHFSRVIQALSVVPREPLSQIVEMLKQARAERKKIFVFGNGGSAANAAHIVNDLLKSTVQPNLPRMRVICLNDNIPALTAYANDIGYDAIFAEPLAALADAGDVVIALSGSGNSPNVLRALETARQLGLTRIGLTGSRGKLKERCDVCVCVPSDSVQVIEDVHLIALHSVFLALC